MIFDSEKEREFLDYANDLDVKVDVGFCVWNDLLSGRYKCLINNIGRKLYG